MISKYGFIRFLISLNKKERRKDKTRNEDRRYTVIRNGDKKKGEKDVKRMEKKREKQERRE